MAVVSSVGIFATNVLCECKEKEFVIQDSSPLHFLILHGSPWLSHCPGATNVIRQKWKTPKLHTISSNVPSLAKLRIELLSYKCISLAFILIIVTHLGKFECGLQTFFSFVIVSSFWYFVAYHFSESRCLFCPATRCKMINYGSAYSRGWRCCHNVHHWGENVADQDSVFIFVPFPLALFFRR